MHIMFALQMESTTEDTGSDCSNYSCDNDARALLDACGRLDLAAAQEALRQGAHLVTAEKSVWTSLHLIRACRRETRIEQRLEISEWILQQPGWGSETREGARNALLVAAEGGSVKLIQLLLAYGAAEIINVAGPKQRTPLMFAVRNMPREGVELLLEAGANVQVHDHWSHTVLIHATASKDAAIAELVVAHGADINVRSSLGLTPLMFACRHKRAATVQFLIGAGAEVDATDNRNFSVLAHLCHRARRKEIIACVEELLRRGVAVNTRSERGVTPLRTAVKFGSLEVVWLLLQHGAEISDAEMEIAPNTTKEIIIKLCSGT